MLSMFLRGIISGGIVSLGFFIGKFLSSLCREEVIFRNYLFIASKVLAIISFALLMNLFSISPALRLIIYSSLVFLLSKGRSPKKEFPIVASALASFLILAIILKSSESAGALYPLGFSSVFMYFMICGSSFYFEEMRVKKKTSR
ncbi:MAG: hypothetical protein NTV63_03650 [Candidatus Woesearchaeota archaeon]|nr:hypothetical protein [Candidatus Woesearchaeota archaeon]